MHDDDQPSVSIELRGGPLGGRVWSGPAVPTVDDHPIHFSISDVLTVIAVPQGTSALMDLDIVLGWYTPTGNTCHDGHKIYVWEMQDARWN